MYGKMILISYGRALQYSNIYIVIYIYRTSQPLSCNMYLFYKITNYLTFIVIPVLL